MKGKKMVRVVPTQAEVHNKYSSLETITQEPQYCSDCHTEIKTQIFKGTGVCGEACYKVVNGEKQVEKAV